MKIKPAWGLSRQFGLCVKHRPDVTVIIAHLIPVPGNLRWFGVGIFLPKTQNTEIK